MSRFRPGGAAYIYYRSTAPTNCALFYSNEPGAATTQSIRVCLERRSDGAKECDPPARGSGPYHTYAGPVFINAPGVCVKVYGTVDPTQGRSETVNSGWVRCREPAEDLDSRVGSVSGTLPTDSSTPASRIH